MIQILTFSQCLQLTLLGYIKLDGRILYLKSKHYTGFNQIPVADDKTIPVMNSNETVLYMLTADQNSARRV